MEIMKFYLACRMDIEPVVRL